VKWNLLSHKYLDRNKLESKILKQHLAPFLACCAPHS